MENAIMKALAGGGDLDTAVQKETLLYMVQRQISCRYTQEILDVRTAVLVEVDGMAPAVLPGHVWDEVKESSLARFAELGKTPTVTDGREFRW